MWNTNFNGIQTLFVSNLQMHNLWNSGIVQILTNNTLASCERGQREVAVLYVGGTVGEMWACSNLTNRKRSLHIH